MPLPDGSIDTRDRSIRQVGAGELLALRPGEIHLWFAFHEEAGEPGVSERYRRLLSAPELARLRCFRFERDRYRYLLTRVLVRTVLSRYVARPAGDWEFTATAFGRPELAPGGPFESEGLDFNLAHTDGLVVLAVTRNGPVGVDAECTRRQLSLERMERVLAPAEASALRALPAGRRSERFLELWTLKESYVKAGGWGLHMPLDRIAFSLDERNRINAVYGPDGPDAPGPWRFWQLRPADDYLVALCAQAASGGFPRLVCRSVVPLEWELEVSLPPSACSREAPGR